MVEKGFYFANLKKFLNFANKCRKIILPAIIITLDNTQIINIIARRMNIESSTAEKLMEGFAGVLTRECRDENRIAIPTFGTFIGTKHNETVVKDLTTGKRLLLPPSIEIEFVAGGRLKNSVGEGRKS